MNLKSIDLVEARLISLNFKYWKSSALDFVKDKLIKVGIGKNREKLLVLGDSHVESFQQTDLQQYFPHYNFRVVPVGGATVSGLQNPNSKTQALPIFKQQISGFSPDKVLIQLGEVDTGFVIWYRAEKYQLPVEDMLKQAVNNYCHLLDDIAKQAKVMCIGTVLPTIKDGQDWGEIANARKEVKASQRQRTELTLRFNEMMHQHCKNKGYVFVSLDKHSVGKNGLVADYLINSNPNDHHYDQEKYADLLVKCLSPVLIEN